MKIGVLGLQGDFARHQGVIRSLGYESEVVRYPEQLNRISGLILPGGESTTMSKLLRRMNMIDALRAFARTRPLLGTCAGIILMGSATGNREVVGLELLDITVQRNAYGRQVHSFSEWIDLVPVDGKNVRGTFIRAPKIIQIGDGIQVLATRKGVPVAVEEGFHIGLTFHPELDGETWFHQRFIHHCKHQIDMRKTDAA